MNQQISVQDERIEQVVAVAKENIKVAITEAKPQTFQVWQNEKVEEVVLEVMQLPQITTTKDVDAQISNLEIALNTAEQQVVSLTAELAKFNDLKVELEKVVNPVYEENQIAVEIKIEEARVAEEKRIVEEEKLPAEEVLPEETPIEVIK